MGQNRAGRNVPHLHLVLPADGVPKGEAKGVKSFMGSYTMASLAGALVYLQGRGLITYEVLDEGASVYRQGRHGVYNPEQSGNERPSLILLSGPSTLIPRAYLISRMANRLGIPVLGGGVHMTHLCDEAIANGVSVVHRGSLPSVRYLWRLIKQAIEGGPNQGLVTRPTSYSQGKTLPTSSFSHFDLSAYWAPFVVQSSEGCLNGCSFCAVPSGNLVVSSTVERFIAELDQLPYGCVFVLADDSFIKGNGTRAEDVERAALIAQIIKDHPNNLKGWATEATILALLNAQALWEAEGKDFLGHLASCNLKVLFTGVEELKKDGEKSLGKLKGLEEEDIVNLTELLRERGIITIGAVVMGLSPKEDEAYIERMRNFLLNFDYIQVSVNTPTPGSFNFLRYAREGVIADFDWRKYEGTQWVFSNKRDPSKPDSPCNIDGELMVEHANYLYESFYSLHRLPKRLVGELARIELSQLNQPSGWRNIVGRLGTTIPYFVTLAIGRNWERVRAEKRKVVPQLHPSVATQIAQAEGFNCLFNVDLRQDPYKYSAGAIWTP